MTFVLDKYYSKFYYLCRPLPFKSALIRLEQLVKLGAVVAFNEARSIDPFRGRCHAKVTVVDDVSYCFGGMNLASKATRNADYMLLIDDVLLADYLDKTVRKIARGGAGQDDWLRLSSRSSVLVDMGLPGQSKIYTAACEMVEGAKTVYYVSQFGPTGPLARLLNRTDTLYYFNRSLSFNIPLGVMLSVDKMISGARTVYRRAPYLHAKFIVARYSDGSTSVLTGSHNFKNQGVRNGTTEIALLSSEPALCDVLLRYAQDLG